MITKFFSQTAWFMVPLFFSAIASRAQSATNGFVSIFEGKTLQGWHASAQTGHSAASKHQSGGRWVVENGVITGSQDIPGNGGILITDRKFGDYEIILEMNN